MSPAFGCWRGALISSGSEPLEGGGVELTVGSEPALGLEGSQSRPGARAHKSVDRARIVSVSRERALGRGDAGGVRSVGSLGAPQSGSVRELG